MTDAPYAGYRLNIALACVVALGACGGSQNAGETSDEPETLDEQPTTEALEATGAQIYEAIMAAEPERLLIDDAGMRRLVDAESGERYAALRLGVRSRIGDVAPHAFEGTHYVGVCLQGARREPAGARLGLREPAFIFERALVAGEMSTGRRVGAWVEGVFVRTDAGFVALDLHSVEDPRWEHTDLEIAPCDMESGIRHPQDVGVATP